ncbi:response regulator [Synechococcus sp. FACHB-909]|uniref:response regulator transcription factor n=1 Tax=Synechococcus sp. FACHB-909 TaxID=2692863 RepID=UPI0016829DDB|nr:response regulator [Synechococcus sp. FACHB-909]MBD2718974.1 response regulator [Synechococcus sp. FACHB-909]
MNSPLPLQGRSVQQAIVPIATQVGTASDEAVAARPTVSIVDDDPNIRAMVAEELADSGCEVVALTNGHDLETRLAEGGIDLVFLDVQMHDCDGIECLGDLRSRGCTVPVVIFTSLNDPERRRQAQEAGADDYVLKHELLDRLPALLERLLPRRSENRHL